MMFELNSYFVLARRIYGLALRHIYLYMGSWPRLVEMMYWPVINIVLYGFVSLSFVRLIGHTDVMIESYLGGLLLAEILSRTTMAMVVMYLEEVWSRNLGHLFASPLQLKDFAASLIALGTIRCTIAIIPAYLVAYFLFNFSILQLGWAVGLYTCLLLLNGWWYGLLILSLLLRFGLAAEWLGWMSTWLLLPFVAPYYPVSILPYPLQVIAYCLPGTYVFESMKEQITSGVIDKADLWIALILNLFYFYIASVVFGRSYKSAQKTGGLLQMGE